MSCTNGAFRGDAVTIEIFLGCSDTAPGSYLALGGVRSKDYEVSNNPINVSSDSSGGVEEYIKGIQGASGSFSGVVLKSAESNSDAVEAYADDDTNTSKAWIKLTRPGADGALRVKEVPIIIESYSAPYAYDTETTFELSWTRDGKTINTTVPA